MREKRLRFAGFEVAIATDSKRAQRIRKSPAYRYFLRPALNLLQRPASNGRHQGGRPDTRSRVTRGGDPAELEGLLSPEAAAVARRVAEIEWYHTIDLPYGLKTPGFVDNRDEVHLYGLPEDMSGMRALDVGTFDGFWALEMERRGASVVATDIGRWSDVDIPLRWREQDPAHLDVPTGAGFRLARELLQSKVERFETSVYDLSPEELGTFDVVVVSDLLQHLRDPQRALEMVYSVTREDGCVIVAEVYNPDLEGFGEVALSQFKAMVNHTWYVHSTATLKLMLNVAGFNPVDEVSRFPLRGGDCHVMAQKVTLKGYPWQRKIREN
ncbi:MAG: methyltransferase domain-containing protein [Dehalococcoidia bacterium]|nr:methyltransferase domain-containing protein [Dehalococcoidia bacterium]